MYNNVALAADKKLIAKQNLRFDITVMKPDRLPIELNKTKGHYHPLAGRNQSSYPEIYEVIFGKAFYLIQTPVKSDFSQIKENYLVEVLPGEKVIIPPNFGHVTINFGSEPLVMTNWVCRSFKSNYQPYLKLGGASYYLLSAKKDSFSIRKNPNYLKVPQLKRLKPINLPKFRLIKGQPMYNIFSRNPKSLEFLIDPQKYRLSIIKLFRNG